MDLSFSRDEIAFRQEVREFIGENLPDTIRLRMEEGRSLPREDVVAWQRILNLKGWATPSWPAEWGGPGWTVVQRHIFLDELHQAPAPEPLSFNVSMLGPVLIAYGTDAQRKRFLPRAANLDDWWAQGFSEPGAGSDLASLTTSARRDGDDYVVNGQKIWQGMAHRADWMFTLVRTGPREGKKQAGISFLLIDLKSEGVKIRPIITIDGRHEVNEVFLDNVRTPVSLRVGAENDGWTVAKFLLTNERVGIARIGQAKRIISRIKAFANRHPVEKRDAIYRRAAMLEAELKILEVTQLRILASMSERQADPRASILKLKAVELRQAAGELLLKTAGSEAYEFAYEDEADAPYDIASNFLTLRGASVFGGATEVQKNILARTYLGN